MGYGFKCSHNLQYFYKWHSEYVIVNYIAKTYNNNIEMSCIEFGFTIEGDSNGKLAKSVDHVAGADYAKSKVLAGYFSTNEFKSHVEKLTGYQNPIDVEPNALRKILNDYFKERHARIDESISVRNAGTLSGFSSAKAKILAKDHTANLILEAYDGEYNKPKAERLNNKAIIKKVNATINAKFNKDVVNPVVKRVKESGNENDQKSIDTLSELNAKIKALNTERNKVATAYNNATDVETKALMKKNVESRDVDINKLTAERYVAFKNFVDKHGNIREKNYSALLTAVRSNPNEWYRNAFTTSKLTNLAGEFETVLESDKLEETNYLDENDIINPNNEGINEMAKTWEDSLYATFDRHVNAKLKTYFSRLYNLSAPVEIGSDGPYSYENNNELGVPTTMGTNYVIAQISNVGQFYSVDTFIDSIANASQSNPSLYGLGVVVNQMMKDRAFANEIFTELANPRINKTISLIDTGDISFDQSNKSADPMSHIIYTMLNDAKYSYTNAFSQEDVETLNKLYTSLSKVNDSTVFNGSQLKKDVANTTSAILRKYFPKFDNNTIQLYLNSNPTDSINNTTRLVNNTRLLVNNVSSMVDSYNEERSKHIAENKKWVKMREFAREDPDYVFNVPAPVFNYNSIDSSRLNAPVIEFAKMFVSYATVKNDLNSINAKGNMASDLIGNNYITNFLKQIQYSTTEDGDIGLERLKEEVIKGEQYRYSPFFFGVQDDKGNPLVDGLFIRQPNGKVIVNPNARNVINVSLFDGVKDNTNAKGEMYAGLSKGDYFFTHMISYKNPVEYLGLVNSNVNTGGFFLRTPSDAPKNFILQAPKYNISGLWTINPASRENYINNIISDLSSRYKFTNEGVHATDSKDIARRINKGNKFTAPELYTILSEGLESISISNKRSIPHKDGTVSIPLVRSTVDTNMIVWMKGTPSPSNKSVIENLTVTEVYETNGEVLSADFLDSIYTTLENQGVESGEIARTINRNNTVYKGLRMHALGEINTFVSQLNNVFKQSRGNWTTRKDTTNLFDIVHFNKGVIVDDGKLTGDFFKFIKLFDTQDYSASSELSNKLFLYGGGDTTGFSPLFSKSGKDGLKLNTSREDLIRIEDGLIKLNISDELNTTIDDVLDNWINSYYREVINRTRQYETIIDSRFSNNDIVDTMFNNAINLMNLDDVFEGDSKFYKNAQTLLKRSKEVQAGGKAYAGFNIADSIGGAILNNRDKYGADIPILLNGEEVIVPTYENGKITDKPMMERNGFRAVTMRSTLRPSDNAPMIKKELVDVLTSELGEVEAERVASDIASGYYANTIANDAQSYITIDEFIRRRQADGTINEFSSLISKLLDPNVMIGDIDIKDVNARIQVQKNFYFDKQFDDITKTYYPRQIKNSEFVLIPKLIQGTDLAKLYDVMRANDISQINTIDASKAAKKNIVTFWDNDGTVKLDEFTKEITQNGGSAVENYYYRYLYKQQNVADHILNQKNKAGIQIMKKINDNSNAEVAPFINDFFTAYVANIKEDFNELLSRMGWRMENDKLVNDKGDGDIKFDEFYKKARVEAQRLGMDSNFIEYLSPESDGKPLMPNYMNNVSSKLESIAQSLFNNAITRQTLPGWHSAQVTNVGYGNSAMDENGNMQKLRYHPATTDEFGTITHEAYAEVMLPRWSSLIPKDYDVSNLSSEGLDIHLGYRIPTEGKQSISVLKVVGFLDSLYGSTIVVPDEWVTQTGSDFDVDSVYGISYEIYKDFKTPILDENGNVLHNYTIKKVTADLSTEKKDVENRYINFINRNIENKVDRDVIEDAFIKNEINELRNSLKDVTVRERESELFKELNASKAELYNRLSNSDKQIVKLIDSSYVGGDIVERYEAIATAFEKMSTEFQIPELKELYLDFAEHHEAIAYVISLSREDKIKSAEAFKVARSAKIAELMEANRLEYLAKVEDAAIKADLMSLEDFKKLPIIEQNTRKARNNIILDSMVNIMSNSNSREENYSRSNFDDLESAMKRLDGIRGASSVKRSTYNPLDQIDFMENAMSVSQLKAFSVTRDTFNSVNNHLKTEISDINATPVVRYDLSMYDLAKLNRAYDNVQVSEDGKYATITHNKLAWSNNNRNVVGKLITTYSSQTTAHILDAIKEGTVFNENDFTFGTLKTLIDVGVDYDTALAFIMQNGVTMINDVYFETKSVYINNTSSPVNTAIKRIARSLNIKVNGQDVNDFTSLNRVKLAISSNEQISNAFESLFGQRPTLQNTFDRLILPVERAQLEQRLANDTLGSLDGSDGSHELKNAVFDLAMIATFDRLHKGTKGIEDLARTTNPDRFGAKQTIRGTRKVLDDINVYSYDMLHPTTNLLTVGGKPMLRSLYPNYGAIGGINIENSKYPYLAAFLKYATIPSVEANSKLFPTESYLYTNVINIVQEKLGKNFNDEQYKEFKQYMMSSVYSGVPYINSPITLNEYGLITLDNDAIASQVQENKFYWNEERARVFGYDINQSASFKVADINNPTKEDITKFNKLTPAQKVTWIQYNFPDGRGLFEFLSIKEFKDVNNPKYNTQRITFDDSIDNIEEIYVAYREAFNSKNAFFRLASIDLIKYAFNVEGFKFKKGGISKIITNDAMYANIEDRGSNIIEAIQQQFNLYANPYENTTKRFMENYVRSHSELVKEVNIPKPKKNKNGTGNIGSQFAKLSKLDGMVYVPYGSDTVDLLEHLSVKQDNTNDYVRITKTTDSGKTTTLYNIVDSPIGVYFVPLNLLERNEVYDYSVNTKNNKFRTPEYYKAVIDVAINDDNIIELSSIGKVNESIARLREASTIKPVKVKKVVESVENEDELQRLMNNGTLSEKGEIGRFVEDINQYLEKVPEQAGAFGLVRNDNYSVRQLIPKGSKVVQSIPNEEGNTLVAISLHTPNRYSKNLSNLLKGDPRGDESQLKKEEIDAYRSAKNAKSVNPTLYKIERVVEEDVREEYERMRLLMLAEAESQMNAITSIIPDADTAFDYSDSDSIAKDIMNELHKRSVNYGDKSATSFNREMELNGVDRYSGESIHNNRQNIYTAASSYYQGRSKELMSQLDSFYSRGGKTYGVNSPELYDNLKDNPSDYDKLVKLLLDAKTFGGQFYDIFNLNLEGEDIETTKAIETIRRSINDVRNSDKVREAFDLMYNNFIASNYSTNPNIRNGFIKLKTAFGDANFFDLHLSSITELDNKQVQTVTKLIYQMVNQAEMFDAPKAIENFDKMYKTIENAGNNLNMDNIIDKEGRFIRPYTEDFLADKVKNLETVREAEDTYGTNSVQHLKAKLDRDIWKAKNMEQPIQKAYYDRDNALRNRVLTTIPDLYSEYMQLTAELYSDDRPISTMTVDEQNERAALTRRINQLFSEFDASDNFKENQALRNAKILKDYIDKKRELNKEVFERESTDGFKKTLDRYLKTIEKYDKANNLMDLDDKLSEPRYKEAYDWIAANTIRTMTDEASNVINNAFNILKSEDHTKSKEVKRIIDKNDALDANGNIDARKIAKEDIAKIKNRLEHKFSWTYDNNAGDAVLVKDIPIQKDVYTSEFYRMLRDESENSSDVNRERLKVMGEINKLVSRGIDVNTGGLSTKLLFEKLTKDELTNLAELYKKLKTIRNPRKKNAKKSQAYKLFTERTNDAAFQREFAYAKQHLRMTSQYDLWLDIFAQVEEVVNDDFSTDTVIVGNPSIFGYSVPKDDKYIDKDKTEARNVLENEVRFVPNEYYYMALKEASNNGTFDQWYSDNHVYNPYTHKMEPLKVWTTMELAPNSTLTKLYDTVSTYENTNRIVKDGFENPNHKPYSANYNTNTGDYNNLNKLSSQEKDMFDLLQGTVDFYANTHAMKVFNEKGFAPRRAVIKPDAKWYASQALGSLGLEFRNTGEQQWSDKVDYTNDFDADFPMMQLLKQKGYKELLKVGHQGTYETDEEFTKRKEEIKEANKAISAENLKLDNEILDRDWQNVFKDFVGKATIYNAKQRAKNSVYMLLEDLKDTKAYKTSNWGGGSVKRDSKRSTLEQTSYQTIDQENTHAVTENWARRVLFDQFKEGSPYSKWADLAQNITSAKYMILNVTGGITNVGTGMVNVFGETFAGTYFDNADFAKAVNQYRSASLTFIKDMYSEDSSNLTVAITKMFDVVDYEAFRESRPNEKATEKVKRVRDALYGMQSIGEHYMQNTALLAMLNSHRIFRDSDGTTRVGSLNDYLWNTEITTMQTLLKDRDGMLDRYYTFINYTNRDLNDVRKYDSFKKDFNEEFLRDLGDRELMLDYIKARKESIKLATEEFNKAPIAIDQFEVIDRQAHIKAGSPLTADMITFIKQKTISVNEKIHGVYSKLGGARIEKSWWGGLAMQYHKFIYPGIMKRYRMKGYYNEHRASIERGSYVTLAEFMATEFRDIKKNVKNRAETDNENIALASLKEVIKASADTIINLKLNYNLMPIWEQNNMKRVLGDLIGVVGAFTTILAIHALTDDDEVKDSNTLATMLYISDRLNSESGMYFPWGLYTEAETLWSSPIAAQNGPKDLMKGLELGINVLFDSEFDPTYSTGLYKGQNKAAVLLYRNTPAFRVYQRLSNMTKNNTYYRINENSMNVKHAKAIADYVNPD